jgi:hypothetical protein
MTKRTRLSLLYAGTGSSRWFRTAASTPDGDLLEQCVWQWKNSSAARAQADSQRPALRLPQFPPAGDFPPTTRKPCGK